MKTKRPIKTTSKKRTPFPCPTCTGYYKTPDDLLQHLLDSQTTQEERVKEVYQAYIKMIFAATKLGYVDDLILFCNSFPYGVINQCAKENRTVPKLANVRKYLNYLREIYKIPNKTHKDNK